MKKLFTFILSSMMAMCLQAQVLFIDNNGKSYADGETMILHTFVDDFDEIMCPSPSLKNAGTTNAQVYMTVDIKRLPSGTTLADCFSGSCTNHSSTGAHNTATVTLAAGASLEKARTIEWNSWNPSKAENVVDYCEVDFTIFVNGTKDKTVKVYYSNLESDDVLAVDGVKAGNAKSDASYTLDGRHTKNNTRGIIVRQGKKYIAK